MILTLGQWAGVLSFVAYLFYIYAIVVKKETKPARSTWWILAFIGLIILTSYKAVGADETWWIVLGDFLGILSIAVISIWYGVGGRDPLDILAFIGALFSLFLWWYFDSPFIALATNLTIDLFAAMPTIYKTWHSPEQEDTLAWTLTILADILAVFVIDKWTPQIYIYPFYTLIIDGIVWILALRTAFGLIKKRN